MTREPHPHRNGRYIDRGHYGRKAVWWAAVVAVFPFAALQAGAQKLADGLGILAGPVWRVGEWAHPCLHKRLPKMAAPDLAPRWKARLPETRSEEKP